MHLFVVGLSHRTAPTEVRERFAGSWSPPGDIAELLDEHFFFTTCNRAELYGAALSPQDAAAKVISALEDHARITAGDDAWYYHQDASALTHLFRVASSLDAMIVGESQIMGQLKAAYADAQARGTTGPVIDLAVYTSLNVARRIKEETHLCRKPVSVASVAVDFIRKNIGAIHDKRCLVIGSGEMGALVAKQLVGKKLSDIMIINRTYERAQVLAEHAGGHAYRLEDLPRALAMTDIVIACAGIDERMVTEAMVRCAQEKREHGPLAIIDIAVPRSIEPAVGKIDGVELATIDSLKEMAEENLRSRLGEVNAAELIVDEEVKRYSEEP